MSAVFTLPPMAGPLGLVCAWLVLGFAGLVRSHRIGWVGYTLFPLGRTRRLGHRRCGVFRARGRIRGAARATAARIAGPALPCSPWMRCPVFFLLLLGTVSAGISVFAAGYFRADEGTSPGLLCLQYHIFLASMAMVILADDAYLFMVAWESMALSSYFLVTTQHRVPEIQRAGFLYLLMAHVGALALLLCFGVLHGSNSLMTFRCDARRRARSGLGRCGLWAGVVRFRRQGGGGASARVVARSPSCRTLPGLRHDERADAESGGLRATARQLRSASWWPMVVGHADAHPRIGHGPVRHRICGRAD